MLLVEHKSHGRDLDRAYRQAVDYFPGLKERDLPRYVLISDFARFRLHDLNWAVDAAYGRKSFVSVAERVAFLFERYQALTSLLPEAKTKKRMRQV